MEESITDNSSSNSSSSSRNTTNDPTTSSATDDGTNNGHKLLVVPNYNVVRLCGWSTSKCGYCHGDRAYLVAPPQDNDAEEQQPEQQQQKSPSLSSSRAYGTWFESLSCEDYLHLIDRGWRRSGKHLYLPDNFHSCCPTFPIRLNVSQFTMDKHQRRVLRSMEKALSPGNDPNSNREVTTNSSKKKVRKIVSAAHSEHFQAFHKNTSDSNTKNSPSLPECVLATVQQWMQNCLLHILQHPSNISSSSKYEEFLASVLPDISTSLCTMKIRKDNKIRKQHPHTKRQDRQNVPQEEEEEQQHVLVTSACAAIAGRSRGLLLAFPLAEQLASRFRSIYTTYNSPCNNDIPIRINKVEALTTGHVTVTLVVLPEDNAAATATTDLKLQDAIHNITAIDNSKSPSTEDTLVGANDTSKELPVVGKRTASSSPTSSVGVAPEEEEVSEEDHLAAILGIPTRRSHSLTVTSVPSEVSMEQPEVHRLYAKYQHAIHGDENPFDSTNSTNRKIEKARKSFERFLVDSPLPSALDAYKTRSTNNLFCIDRDGYDILIPCGSYHQQYRIDGKLIAVGVVDILPIGLSSVYCFYDPTLSSSKDGVGLNLGKYTALREIQWMERAAIHRGPDFKYYYLGFYIHSCQKMKYKAEYKPCALLCPSKRVWVGFDIAKPLIEESSPKDCCTIAVEDEKRSSDAATLPKNNIEEENNTAILDQVINDMLIEIGQNNNDTSPQQISVAMLNSYGRKIVCPLIEDFVTAVGPTVSKRCIVRL